MKKNVGLILILIIIIGGTVFLYLRELNKDRAHSPLQNSTSTPALSQPILTPKKTSEKNITAGYEINTEYPEVSGLQNKDAERKINKTIYDQILNLTNDFKKSSQEIAPMQGEVSSLDIGYRSEVFTILPNIVAFRMSETYFEAGAAHPGNMTVTFNFDTQTGNVMTLDSLFTPGSEYLKRIATYVQKDLKNKYGDSDLIAQGAAPKAENYEAFVITDAGIRFIFNQYQVAAYAAGEPEVLVPYVELYDVLSKTGPLGRIVQ